MNILLIVILIIAALVIIYFIKSKRSFHLFLNNYDFETGNLGNFKLDFPNMNLKIIGWQKNYIRITPNEFTKRHLSLIKDDNTIFLDNLNNNSFTDSRTGLIIMVPRNILLDVKGKKVRLYKSLINSINSEEVLIRDGSLLKESMIDAKTVIIRDSNIKNSCTIYSNRLFMRDSQVNSLSIIRNDAFGLKEFVNEIKYVLGKEISFNTGTNHHTIKIIKKCKLDKIVLNRENSEIGDILIEKNCEIGEIENNFDK